MTLIMSVSGTRGLVGNGLTPLLATELAAAWGTHLGGGLVLLGRDSRPSGQMLRCAVAAGLLAVGCDCIDLGIVSTPGVALMIEHHQAAGGVVLTASHNPAQWNGIKLLTRAGHAPEAADAQRVFERCRAGDLPWRDHTGVGRLRADDSTNERHVARVLDIADVGAIRNKRFRVVLDSVNGAGGLEGRLLLERLGCEVFHINGEASGDFAHNPEPTAENLSGLCEAVRKHRADAGFAQDPDADRLAIVDETGRYLGEEYTLALAAMQRLAQFGASSTQKAGPLATNLSTSRMIDDIAAGGGTVVHRSPVGEAHVVAAMREHGCILGGEGNGGVIDPRVVSVRDSLTGMALVLGLMASRGGPLGSIADALPRYTMIKRKYEQPRERIDAALTAVRTAAGASSSAKLCDLDGLRIDWPEGWVHLRASNTEPIARLIAEARDHATAEGLVQRVEAWMGWSAR